MDRQSMRRRDEPGRPLVLIVNASVYYRQQRRPSNRNDYLDEELENTTKTSFTSGLHNMDTTRPTRTGECHTVTCASSTGHEPGYSLHIEHSRATLGPLAHGPEKKKMSCVAQASEPCLEELRSTGPAWYCPTVKFRDDLG